MPNSLIFIAVSEKRTILGTLVHHPLYVVLVNVGITDILACEFIIIIEDTVIALGHQIRLSPSPITAISTQVAFSRWNIIILFPVCSL